MPRNLDRRVETLFPISDPTMKKALLANILGTELRDNQKMRLLTSDGSYVRRQPAHGEEPMDSQAWFLEHKGIWYHAEQ